MKNPPDKTDRAKEQTVESLNNLIDSASQKYDELRLKAKLAKMEASDKWKEESRKLGEKIDELKSYRHSVAAKSSREASDVKGRIERCWDEFTSGCKRAGEKLTAKS